MKNRAHAKLALPAAATLLLLSGCATTESLDELRAAVQQAQNDAREATQVAGEARDRAQQAEQAADAASRRAEQAERTANAADERSIQTEKKIDEMFRRTMLK